jgi:hypothetical protein
MTLLLLLSLFLLLLLLLLALKLLDMLDATAVAKHSMHIKENCLHMFCNLRHPSPTYDACIEAGRIQFEF